MAILVPPTTAATDRKARKALRALALETLAPLSSGDAESGGSAPEPVEAIPIYAPRIGPRTRSLRSARQIGWRYLVTNSDDVGAVDVATETGTEAQLVGQPEVAERLARAARLVEDAAGTDADDYEMRLLDLSMIGDSVLWLANRKGADRFFTYGEEPKEIDEEQIRRTLQDGARAIRANARNADPEAGG